MSLLVSRLLPAFEATIFFYSSTIVESTTAVPIDGEHCGQKLNDRCLVISYQWLPATSYQRLSTNDKLPVTSYQWLATGDSYQYRSDQKRSRRIVM